MWDILLHIVNHGAHRRSELSRYLDGAALDYNSFVEQTAGSADPDPGTPTLNISSS